MHREHKTHNVCGIFFSFSLSNVHHFYDVLTKASVSMAGRWKRLSLGISQLQISTIRMLRASSLRNDWQFFFLYQFRFYSYVFFFPHFSHVLQRLIIRCIRTKKRKRSKRIWLLLNVKWHENFFAARHFQRVENFFIRMEAYRRGNFITFS